MGEDDAPVFEYPSHEPHLHPGWGGASPPAAPAGGESPTVRGFRLMAGIVGGAIAVLWALILWMVLGSAYDTDPSTDPHGYGIVFGFLIHFPVGILCCLTLAFALPRRHWWWALAAAMPVFAAITVLVYLAVENSPSN